ncbi:MAG: hypothetical protein KGI47_05615 [Betaproteobacteria bacterium]|nr:hypothetical protein [Betaproteobacteria bacterium]MDE2622767.1 hypothetical protein [Betaproteobacteria bacterium]
MIKTLFAAALAAFVLTQTAHAATSAPSTGGCEARAVDKHGKPLAGAAKASFLKKCEKENKATNSKAGCEAKAIGKNGKPLAGAAKNSFMKKCLKEAGH